MGVRALLKPDALLLGRQQMSYFDHFEYFVSGDRFTDTSADTGAAVAMTDAAGGVLTLTTGATNNNECYLHTTKEVFLFAAGKPLYVEAKVKFTEANTDDANVLVGIMDAVGADSILDDGAGPKASYSGACFFCVDSPSGTKVWNVESSLGGTQTTTVLTALNSLNKIDNVPGGGTWQALGISFVPINSTTGEIVFTIDGVVVAKHTITYTSATEMMQVVGVKAGGANSEVVSVDYKSGDQII